MEATISVIVPYYRGESFLKDCLDSLNKQTFKDFEVILVGDGCGSEAERVIADFDALNIRFVRTDAEEGKPAGVAIARNLGIDEAEGKYLFFLDSDDFISEHCLESLVSIAEEKKNVSVRARFFKTWFGPESAAEEEKKKREEALAENRPDTVLDDEDPADDKATAEEEHMEDSSNKKDDLEGETEFSPYVYGASTAHGILMPASLVKDRYLRFSYGFTFYSDLPFICELCEMLPLFVCRDEVYFQRNHNDGIRMPSLNQIESDNRLGEFVESFNVAWSSARAYLENDDDSVNYAGIESVLPLDGAVTGSRVYKARVADYLERYLVKFLVRNLMKHKHPKGLKWSVGQLSQFSEFVKEVKKKNIAPYNFRRRLILKKIGKGKCKSAMRIAKFYCMQRKKKGLFGSALQWKWNFYKRIFIKKPVKKNLYLFESFLGKTYGDSPRYIYEYLRKHDEGTDNEYVWVIDNKDAKIPGKHKQVKPLSLKYFYYTARAGVLVNNMRQPSWYIKRDGVKFVETWHGTPLKKLVFDMDEVHSASPRYKMTFYKQSRIWDYLISDNAFSTECFKSAFLFPEDKIIELGYPRNDLLYGADRDERAAAVKEKLGIPKDKKVVLYAPTWRDDDYYGPGQYKFDLPLDLKMMRKLKDKYFFVLRTHYFIADHLQISEEDKDFVMDQSRYNDIGELYLISDILITDYSSVFFDFANLRRPILFFTYDLEKYASVLRGFYFDMTTGCPGPLLKTNEEVLDALENIDRVSAEYRDKYEDFCNKFCYLDDGNASERIVKKTGLLQ